MPIYRKVVLTIHGINSDGQWQEEAKEVLEPHFRCKPLAYTQFRRLGWLKVVFGRLLGNRAIATVAQQYGDETTAGERPHLIAHSFGTWIAVRLMPLPSIAFEEVIFAGSPLPRAFNWRDVLVANPMAFRNLTNETGPRDWVIALSGLIGKLFPHLGSAGRDGFLEDSDLVHSTDEPRPWCSLCEDPRSSGASTAKIHNVSRAGFSHSTWWVGNNHPANVWLPFLWGIRPEDYARFIELCLQAVTVEENKEWQAAREVETELLESRWSWTMIRGRQLTLGEYVSEEIRAYVNHQRVNAGPEVLERARARAIRMVYLAVAQAIEERRKSPGVRKDNRVLRLHPRTAVGAAVESAVKKALGQRINE